MSVQQGSELTAAPATTDVQAAIDAGMALGGTTAIGAVPLAVVPAGAGVAVLERLLDRPSGKRGAVEFFDVASFAEYLKAHKGDGTDVYVDVVTGKFSAVLDWHGAGADGDPGWGQHRASLVPRPSRAWVAWTEANRRKFDQVAFAEFVEARIRDIAEPAGAALLELVQTFSDRRDVAFSSAVNLANGAVQLAYADGDVKGNANVPRVFKLGIAPFEGDPLYVLEARLRYRIAAGKLSIWYELDEPERLIEASVADRKAAIIKATDLAVWAGNPPAPVRAL
jgi:uncharacterized protein YfdQ (DUF2303 family)